MQNIIPPDAPLKQCNRCLEIKPVTAFSPSKVNSDGIEHTCRVCRQLIREKKISGVREFQRQCRILPETKACNKCGRILPINPIYFQRSHNSPDGFMHRCKKCRNQYRNEWSHMRKPLQGPLIENGKQRCCGCKEWLPLTPDYFSRQCGSKAGFLHRCKSCMSAKKKTHYEAHPEIYVAMRERQRENHRTYKHRRRALEQGNHYTAMQVREQYDRQNGKCYWCGIKIQGKNYHVDHIVPITRGGMNDISNIVVSCPHCNVTRNNKLPHEWPEGGRLL